MNSHGPTSQPSIDPAALRTAHTEARVTRGNLREVALLFLKLGCIAFGGPAAHIAMMRDEVVRRRQWVSDQEFLDLLGATNLIPGPNSTEMAMDREQRGATNAVLQAGRRGLSEGVRAGWEPLVERLAIPSVGEDLLPREAEPLPRHVPLPVPTDQVGVSDCHSATR
jgi:hypothetical protein